MWTAAVKTKMHLIYRAAGDMDTENLMMQDLRFTDIIALCIKTRKFRYLSAHKGAAIKLSLPISPSDY
jgi:hypothetical protein